MKIICFYIFMAFWLVEFNAHAEEEKHYNFNVHTPSVVHHEEQKIEPEVKVEEPAVEKETPEPEKKAEEKSTKKKEVAKKSAKEPDEASRKIVRFFIGSCLKFYGRNQDLKKYMDDKFPALDTERKAAFAPVIEGTIDTVYWDVTLDNSYLILAKNMSSGKCDVIAKEATSSDVHAELKAVMDGMTITNILQTQTTFETYPAQNKSVSIVNIQGHPLEKEMGIVATTEIKPLGDNLAAILTLFAVPQETVVVK